MSNCEQTGLVIIFDGPQGSGKTTATNFLSDSLGYRGIRGIPEADSLQVNKLPQNWLYTHQTLINNYKSDILIVDRCLWSFVSFESHKRGHFELLYRLGLEQFRRTFNKIDYTLILLASEPDKCIDRKKHKISPYKWNTSKQVEDEVLRYDKLFANLRIDNVNVERLENNNSLDSFFNNLLDLERRIRTK